MLKLCQFLMISIVYERNTNILVLDSNTMCHYDVNKGDDVEWMTRLEGNGVK